MVCHWYGTGNTGEQGTMERRLGREKIGTPARKRPKMVKKTETRNGEGSLALSLSLHHFRTPGAFWLLFKNVFAPTFCCFPEHKLSPL